MSTQSSPAREQRIGQRPDSSYNRGAYGAGIAVRCQVCSNQSFRRSTLRAADFTQIFLMRYPVRCLRCSHRQMVSFTVAGISLPSSVKPQKIVSSADPKHWTEPSGEAGIPGIDDSGVHRR